MKSADYTLPRFGEQRYDFNDKCSASANSSISTNNSYEKVGCSYGYVYDMEEGRNSIVTEWDLVCDRQWMQPLIMSIYMSGVLIGSLVSGGCSDKFGRFPSFMLGTAFMFIFLGLCGVSSSPIMFAVFLFFAGLFAFVNYVTAFIISTEIINTKDRVVTGTLAVGGFALGYMLLPLFAYNIRNWRNLCFVLASTGVFFIPYFWLMAESPRWLYSKSRKSKEFIQLFKRIARTNGVKSEKVDELLKNHFGDLDSCTEIRLLNEVDDKVELKIEKASKSDYVHYSYLDLIRIRRVLPRTLSMWFVWFVCSVIYYGVAFNTSNMGGNPYVNCFIAAAVEVPAYAVVMLLLQRQGRKPILISTLLMAGLTCAAVPYLETIGSEFAIASAMIGKFAVSAAFSIVFIFCSELFPTLMRSMGVGSSSMAARVGGMIAPYLLYLGDSNHRLPFLLMGFLGVSAAIISLLLPETKESTMPDSVEDLSPVSCTVCIESLPILRRSRRSDSASWNTK